MQKFVSTIGELMSIIEFASTDLTHDLQRAPWAMDEIGTYWHLVAALSWVEAHAEGKGEETPRFIATRDGLEYETASGTKLTVTRYASACDGHEPCAVSIEHATREGGDYESADADTRTPDPAGEDDSPAFPSRVCGSDK